MPKVPSIAEVKAFLDRAKAYKEQFTGGFYHGSPSPNIKAFDASKGDKAFPTEGVTFVTRNPSFAEGFLDMHRNRQAGGWDYDKGSTIYPVSVNLGKHFVPGSKEGKELIDQYIAKLPNDPDSAMSAAKRAAALKAGSWDVMEDPRFLEYLKNTGHDTFTVVEGGIPNVGVFEPHNIRGKFAEFNPDEAMNPDFMKADGGLVHLAPGGKVGALSELINLIRNQGGTTAARRLERAADLVPNLEHQYQPEALKGAFTGDNASAVMVMRPADFEKYAAPISAEHKVSPTKGYGIGNAENFESYTEMPKGTYQDYIDYLGQYSAPGGGGFSSVPFLQLSQKPNRIFPNIEGHEGRHRTAALEKHGEQSTIVKMLPTYNLRENLPRRSQEEYLNALIEKIGQRPAVKPQLYFDPSTEKEVSRSLIDLPEMFKDGGDV